MAKRRLTAASIARIRLPDRGQIDIFDQGFPGLCLRLSYGGTRAWSAFVRVNGKQRRIALGSFPAMSLAEARDAWRNAGQLAAAGRDPKGNPRPSGDGVDAVVAEWLRRDQSKNRSVAEVKRLFEHDVLPEWQSRKIGEILRHDCMLLIDRVADRGAVTMARRLHSHLHRFFRWSVGRGIITANPIADAPKIGAEEPRDRVLTERELKAVWLAAKEIGWPFGTITQLLILTGLRREEVGGLRWDEIEPQRQEIRLGGQRTKTNKPHLIPLSPQAIELLLRPPRMLDCPFVFSTNGKTPVSGWAKAKTRLDKASGVDAWRLHDLRRTTATGLQRLGVGLQVVEAILGHASGSRSGIVGIYQRHDYAEEKRAALTLWGEMISGLRGDTARGENEKA